MEPTPSDEATAYHEAGHAVVALALGRPVHRVSILPRHERLGQCEFRKPVVRSSEDWLENEILIALAGLAAEARRTGAYALDAAGRDRRYVHRLALSRVSERSFQRFERRMLAKVEHILADEAHWRTVELIAAELLAQRTISGRAARHLFDRAEKGVRNQFGRRIGS